MKLSCFKCHDTRYPLNSDGLCLCCGEPDEMGSTDKLRVAPQSRGAEFSGGVPDAITAVESTASSGFKSGVDVLSRKCAGGNCDAPATVRECWDCPAKLCGNCFECLHCWAERKL